MKKPFSLLLNKQVLYCNGSIGHFLCHVCESWQHWNPLYYHLLVIRRESTDFNAILYVILFPLEYKFIIYMVHGESVRQFVVYRCVLFFLVEGMLKKWLFQLGKFFLPHWCFSEGCCWYSWGCMYCLVNCFKDEPTVCRRNIPGEFSVFLMFWCLIYLPAHDLA